MHAVRTEMSRKKPADLTIVTEGNSGASLATALQVLGELGETPRPDLLDDGGSTKVRERINKIADLASGVDCLELLAHLRCADVSIGLRGIPESSRPIVDTHAVSELLAVILLALGLPRTTDQMPGSSAKVVTAIRQEAALLLGAAQFSTVAKHAMSSDAVEKLAARHRSGTVLTRGAQYGSISERNTAGFLETPPVSGIVEGQFGFTPAEVRLVADAITELQNSRLIASCDRMAEAVASGIAPEDVNLRTAMTLLVCPQDIFVLAVKDIAAAAGVDIQRTRAILDVFSVAIPQSDPIEAALAVMRGISPLSTRGLIRLDQDTVFPMGTAIMPESFRSTLEAGLPKNTATWAKYNEAREKWSEAEAVRQVARLLNVTDATHTSLDYLAPEEGVEPSALGADTQFASGTFKKVEADAVFVVDQVAFCIEVKAGSLLPEDRAGDQRRLLNGLDSIVRSASDQAERLRSLILSNQGIWTPRRQWISFEGVREVRSIVVTLDDCGPVLLSMPHLIDAGLIATNQVPWVVSLHDLHVTADVLSWPAQFLCYLRRRTHSEAFRWLDAVDELDYLMAFVKGLLFFESDPYQPNKLAIKANVVAQRRRYAKQGKTFIGTHTDDLDAYYYNHERGEAPAPLPARDEGEFVEWFLEAAQRYEQTGWLRFGALLVGLSDAGRSSLSRKMIRVRLAGRKGERSSFTICGEDDIASWLLFIANENDSDVISEYLPAKKYQVHADLALGMVFSSADDSVSTLFLDEPWQHDELAEAAVEKLVRAGKLRELRRTPQAIPPSARRATKRLRDAKKQRHQRG